MGKPSYRQDAPRGLRPAALFLCLVLLMMPGGGCALFRSPSQEEEAKAREREKKLGDPAGWWHFNGNWGGP